jgi:hypothetical protein
MRRSFSLMLRSIAARSGRAASPSAVALRCVSKHEAAREISKSGPTSSFETRARKTVRAPQDEVGMKVAQLVDEMIE